MNDDFHPPLTFTLREFADRYDDCVALVLKADTIDQVPIAKCVANLFLLCRILLATHQISEVQSTIVEETKERCATKLGGKEGFDQLLCNEVVVEYNPSSGKWSWNFDKKDAGEGESDDDNLICLDQEQLEQEEQELMWMANAPIPSSSGRNKIRKFGA
jgi:hypothetical protein